MLSDGGRWEDLRSTRISLECPTEKAKTSARRAKGYAGADGSWDVTLSPRRYYNHDRPCAAPDGLVSGAGDIRACSHEVAGPSGDRN